MAKKTKKAVGPIAPKPKKRKLTDADKIQILAEIDAQGLDYWIQNYSSEYLNTEIGPDLEKAKEALNSLENEIQGWSELLLDEDGDYDDEGDEE